MSRSFKKTPIVGACAQSDKGYKVAEHRRERTHVRVALRQSQDGELLPHPKQFGNPWDGGRDGKRYLSAGFVVRK